MIYRFKQEAKKMGNNNEQLLQVSELIYKGLNAKALPDKDNDYRKLIAKWEASEQFRDQVNIIAKGMRLKVADVTYEAGAIVLPLDHNSAFRFGGLTEIRKVLGNNKVETLSKRGTVVLGIITLLATFFRDEVDFLEYKQSPQTRSISQIATLLLEICNSLKDQYDDDKGDIPEYLREAWKIVLQLPRVKDGRSDPNSIEGIIDMLANHFVNEGLLVLDTSYRDEKAWFPTQRFIAQAERDTATRVYEYCMEIHQDQCNKRKNEETSE